MEVGQENSQNQVFTTLQHRASIGVMGIALPVLLYIVGKVFYDVGLQESISYYYYTGARDWFVGLMFAISIYMFSYKGPEGEDRYIGIAASITGLMLAIFSTDPVATPLDELSLRGRIHMLSSMTFLLTLVYFSLVLFTRSAPGKHQSHEKHIRNIIYRWCAYLMFVCLVLIAILLVDKPLYHNIEQLKPVFWLESTAVWAFGISWLTKGEVLFHDKQS